MRIWNVAFQTIRPLASLPFAGEVVREIQFNPSYRLDGLTRFGDLIFERGGQLVCTLKGRGVFEINGVKHQLTPGKAFFALHYDDHSYYYPEDETEPWEFIWITVLGPSSFNIISDVNKQYGYVFDLDIEKGFIKKLLSYESYRGTTILHSPTESNNIVGSLLTAVVDSAEKEHETSADNKFVADVIDMVREGIEHNITVTKVAKKLNLSREHLSRLFKEYSGRSLNEYIQSQKILIACDLLQKTHLSCKEIAERVGYESPAAFNRAFKKNKGTSPKKYGALGAK